MDNTEETTPINKTKGTKEETKGTKEDIKDTKVKDIKNKNATTVDDQDTLQANVGHHHSDELTKSTPTNNGTKMTNGMAPPTMKAIMATMDGGTTTPTTGVGNNPR